MKKIFSAGLRFGSRMPVEWIFEKNATANMRQIFEMVDL
jgi:hypothetical protein